MPEPKDLFEQMKGALQAQKLQHDAELVRQATELRRKYQRQDQAPGYRDWRGDSVFDTPVTPEALREALRGVWGKLSPEVQDELEAYLE